MLSGESDDEELLSRFTSAGDLNANFYERRMSQEEVAFHLRQVARFVEKVEALLD